MTYEIKRLGYPEAGDFVQSEVVDLLPKPIRELEEVQRQKLTAYQDSIHAEREAKDAYENADVTDAQRAQDAVAAGKQVPEPTKAAKKVAWEKAQIARDAHRVAYGEARVAKEQALKAAGPELYAKVKKARVEAAQRATDCLSGFSGEWERVQDVTGLLTGLDHLAQGERPEFRRGGAGLPGAREKVLVPTPAQLVPELVAYLGNFHEEDDE